MCQVCWDIIVRLAKWDTRYINNLPDAAFAYIEPAYKRGDTKNKNARHLPHHSDGVKNGRDSKDHIDLPHLRNALARVDQIKPVTDSVTKDRLVSQAKAHLEKHAKDLKIGGRGEKSANNILEKFNRHVNVTPGQPPPPILAPSILSLAEPLAAKGLEVLNDGCLRTKLEGRLLSFDTANISNQGFKVRLAERENQPAGIVDVQPKPEDFITIDYRALSKVIIPHRFLDFTDGNVLKKSAKMLAGVTFYPDHNARVENWLGSVEDSWWDEKSEPNGIDARVRLDALANPRITRGVLGGALTRVSTTLWFQWKKSHELDDYEFIKLLGSELDGQMVRFIVKQIDGYGEMSLVWYGADPHAKEKSKVKAEAKE